MYVANSRETSKKKEKERKEKKRKSITDMLIGERK